MAPASHPQAQFIPISPDFDLHALVENTYNFDYVTRLSTEKLKEHSIQSFEALVLAVVIQSGKPLVIEDWGESLPPWLYNPEWIQENLGAKPEQVRDIPNEVNIPMTIGHYLRSMETLTNRITPSTYRDPKRQRLYLKDIDTPEQWANHLKEVMPESVYYLNDCIEPRTGGDGAIREPNEYGQMVYGKGVAPAGDLMSSLPPEMRAMNMMCYIGHEGTYTPAHREMCASLGHNIMVEASENKKGEKAGSSIWFMTETKEREVVSEYFLSMLGHDIEVEKHFAQINAWKKAPFNVWVVEQKVGDLILIPPLAPHQVWNRGTRTMKAAWNRTTVDTLELALHEALPRARMVCREEQYKNKAIVYYTLLKYQDLLQRDTVEEKMWKYGRIKQVLEDFKRLFALYTEILISEMFSPKLPEETDVEFIEYDSNITCSYCRGNIFNRFLTCKSCIQVGPGGEEDTYDICMDCYAMGRSCACISNLSWVEQWSWHTLVDNYDLWKNTVERVLQAEGSFDKDRAPKHLEIARKRYGRKPVAEVCQEQLRIRPWTDITKEVQREPSPMSEEEPDVDDEGRIKKKKKGAARTGGTRGKFVPVKNKTHTCHICCYHDWNWKLAFCSTCNKAYCYGTLWRAFDLMPQTVMEDKEWSCPCCLKICSCGKCRRDPRQKPYSPKGTLLGHDTKKVADFRSVESLVDFSKTNLAWLRGEDENDPQQSSRMKKLKEKAEVEKARVEKVDDNYLEGVEHTAFGADNGEGSAQAGGNHDIDPFLLGTAETPNGQYNGNYENGQFDLMDGTTNSEINHATPGPDANMNADWMGDGHYDFDDFDPTNSHNQNQNQHQNQNQAGYPSRLLAPTLPEQSYPDPTHVGQDRMMGAGFYKQGNGADRILFDAPEENGVEEEIYQPTPAQNPNFALSDLMDPAYQTEAPKKRRRMGEDGVEDEEEFFTSKRQKKIAKAKELRQRTGDDTEADLMSQPAHRQPRRSMGKTIYTDLGEDAVPIEEGEGPSSVRNRTNEQKNRNPKEPLTDIELAAQALSRLTHPSTEAAPVRRRGRPKGTGEVSGYSPATNTIKTPRKSAWLARKEAADSDGVSIYDDPPSELPKRTRGRPRSSLQKTSTIIDIPSASEDSDDDDDGGVVLHDDDDDDDNDNDSLFGEPIGREGSLEAVGNDNSINEAVDKAPSSKEHSVEIADPTPFASGIEIQALGNTGPVNVSGFVEPNKPTPKRRGRPPKNPRPAESESMSPALLSSTSAAPVTKFLSLKEKLALKGKAFKIVAKPQASVASSSAPPSASNTPGGPLKSILKTSTTSASPAWNKFDEEDAHDTSPLVSSSSRPAKPAVSTPTPEVKKGPTVVRLLSPSTEANNASSRSRSQSVSSDSDFGSDTSIPAVRISGNQARRGGRGGTAVRGRGRPRGRPLLGRVV